LENIAEATAELKYHWFIEPPTEAGHLQRRAYPKSNHSWKKTLSLGRHREGPFGTHWWLFVIKLS